MRASVSAGDTWTETHSTSKEKKLLRFLDTVREVKLPSLTDKIRLT